MRATLRDLLRNCRLALKKFLNKRDKWVKEWAGQVSWGPENGGEGKTAPKGAAKVKTAWSRTTHRFLASCSGLRPPKPACGTPAPQLWA